MAESILAGTYQHTSTGPTGRYLKLLLDQLKTKLPALSTDITEKDVKKGFKVWKEITSTSPSNRHLRHYKPLLRPDGRGKTTTTQLLATGILQVHHRMMALCAKRGISLHRWQEIVTTMLEKEAGHPKLH
jgi:hypothetical protein